MKRIFSAMILLFLFTSTNVFAKDKTSYGAQIGFPLYPAVFVNMPISDQSLIRLEVGTFWGISVIAGARYRRHFGASNSKSYFEVSALYFDRFYAFGGSAPGGLLSTIGFGTQFSKRENGTWIASLAWGFGPVEQAFLPTIGYEFAL